MHAANVVELGDKVQDQVTNFKGVVVAYSNSLHNCDRAQVQCSEYHEGKPVEPIWFDVPRLQVLIKEQVKPMVVADFNSVVIKLGDEVKDNISGFKGIADSRGVWLTGCIRFGVNPTSTKKEGGLLEDYWFPHTQLSVVKAAPIPKVAIKPPGGPGKSMNMRKDPQF